MQASIGLGFDRWQARGAIATAYDFTTGSLGRTAAA